jgi:hypothetical protein
MTPTELVTKAFLRIQEDKQLFQQWNDTKTEADRTLMLMEQAYAMGLKEGLENPYDYGI